MKDRDGVLASRKRVFPEWRDPCTPTVGRDSGRRAARRRHFLSFDSDNLLTPTRGQSSRKGIVELGSQQPFSIRSLLTPTVGSVTIQGVLERGSSSKIA